MRRKVQQRWSSVLLVIVGLVTSGGYGLPQGKVIVGTKQLNCNGIPSVLTVIEQLGDGDLPAKSGIKPSEAERQSRLQNEIVSPDGTVNLNIYEECLIATPEQSGTPDATVLVGGSVFLVEHTVDESVSSSGSEITEGEDGTSSSVENFVDVDGGGKPVISASSQGTSVSSENSDISGWSSTSLEGSSEVSSAGSSVGSEFGTISGGPSVSLESADGNVSGWSSASMESTLDELGVGANPNSGSGDEGHIANGERDAESSPTSEGTSDGSVSISEGSGAVVVTDIAISIPLEVMGRPSSTISEGSAGSNVSAEGAGEDVSDWSSASLETIGEELSAGGNQQAGSSYGPSSSSEASGDGSGAGSNPTAGWGNGSGTSSENSGTGSGAGSNPAGGSEHGHGTTSLGTTEGSSYTSESVDGDVSDWSSASLESIGEELGVGGNQQAGEDYRPSSSLENIGAESHHSGGNQQAGVDYKPSSSSENTGTESHHSEGLGSGHGPAPVGVSGGSSHTSEGSGGSNVSSEGSDENNSDWSSASLETIAEELGVEENQNAGTGYESSSTSGATGEGSGVGSIPNEGSENGYGSSSSEASGEGSGSSSEGSGSGSEGGSNPSEGSGYGTGEGSSEGPGAGSTSSSGTTSEGTTPESTSVSTTTSAGSGEGSGAGNYPSEGAGEGSSSTSGAYGHGSESDCYGYYDEVDAQYPIDYTEAGARNYINEIMPVLQERLGLLADSTWQLYNDVNENNFNVTQEIQDSNMRFLRAVAKRLRRYDFTIFEDKNLQRMTRVLSKYGYSALPCDRYEKLQEVLSEMRNNYNEASVCQYRYEEFCDIPLVPDVADVMATSRDPEELKHYWIQWHDVVGKSAKRNFKKYIALASESALLNGFPSMAEYWLDAYEHRRFEEEMSVAMNTISQLYVQLHGYVRYKIRLAYGEQYQEEYGPIQVNLLGDMFGETWENIAPLAMPYPEYANLDVTDELLAQEYTPRKMFELAEEFFLSMNMSALPSSFWVNSVLEDPVEDISLLCDPAVMNMYDEDDIRARICTNVDGRDLSTIFSLIGQAQYMLQYRNQPAVYQEQANPGFQETIGQLISQLTSTPRYLTKVHLLNGYRNTRERKVNRLFLTALKKVAFLPFAYSVDQYRMEVFRHGVSRHEYNCKFWELRSRIAGVEPPVGRKHRDFDPAALEYVSADIDYIQHIFSTIAQFQIQKGLCRISGDYGHRTSRHDLSDCSIANSAAAGNALKSVMQLGSSKSWTKMLYALTGYRGLNAEPMLEYFQPLYVWLKNYNEQNHVPLGWVDSARCSFEDK